MKTRKRHEFTDEELDRERTPVDFNIVPWKTDIRVVRERINKAKKRARNNPVRLNQIRSYKK